MNNKVAIATGSEDIYNYLTGKEYDVMSDIPYQEGVLELVKRESIDVLIIYAELDGENDKYSFVEKLRKIRPKLKIIVIIKENDENYKKFLWSQGVFDIFVEGVTSFNKLETAINSKEYKVQETELNQANYTITQKDRSEVMVPKYQKQQVIAFTGIGSSGKTTIATKVSQILAEKTKSKVLLIDFDTVNAGINQFVGVKREPENPGYILPLEKNSSLNYMIDAIDRRNFNSNIFEKYVLKSKLFPNLDVLTGNKSLYICKNILSLEYYSRILEVAKSLYDYIIIDASGNIFLDSMQFSVLNSNQVFVVAEGNYISLERNYRLMSELFPVWGVYSKKVHVIINKYNQKSLYKETIKEMLKESQITGYIKFSDKYEDEINSMNSKLQANTITEYYPILKELKILEDNNYDGYVKHPKQRICKNTKMNFLSFKLRKP